MPERSRKRPVDLNSLAASIVADATDGDKAGEPEDTRTRRALPSGARADSTQGREGAGREAHPRAAIGDRTWGGCRALGRKYVRRINRPKRGTANEYLPKRFL